MKSRQPKSLDRVDARRRIERLTEHWREKYGITASWAGDEASLSRKVKGFHLDAHLVVGDTRANATGADPSFLVRGTVIKCLKTTLARYLAPATPIDGLAST